MSKVRPSRASQVCHRREVLTIASSLEGVRMSTAIRSRRAEVEVINLDSDDEGPSTRPAEVSLMWPQATTLRGNVATDNPLLTTVTLVQVGLPSGLPASGLKQTAGMCVQV